MKKIIFILCMISLFSCKKELGTISGVVTYFFNEYQGDKPDIGAKVYIIQNREDLKESISMLSKIKPLDYLKLTYEQNSIERKALIDSETITCTVDGSGKYSMQVPSGEYVVIVESNGRVDSSRKMTYVSVKSNKISNFDCKFDLN